MKNLLIISALLLPVSAFAEVPCFEYPKPSNDGFPSNASTMYDTNWWRGWAWGKVQEMDDAERRKARSLESIASLIGPCILPNGEIFHMVDRNRR